MALDSAVKRFSTMHTFSGGWVLPGATFDTDDRRDVIGDYRGITSGSVAPPVVYQGSANKYLPFADILFDMRDMIEMRFVGLLKRALEAA